MSNMSYCRFENTLKDLLDCYENLDDPTLEQSKTELVSREQLIDLCRKIVYHVDSGQNDDILYRDNWKDTDEDYFLDD